MLLRCQEWHCCPSRNSNQEIRFPAPLTPSPSPLSSHKIPEPFPIPQLPELLTHSHVRQQSRAKAGHKARAMGQAILPLPQSTHVRAQGQHGKEGTHRDNSCAQNSGWALGYAAHPKYSSIPSTRVLQHSGVLSRAAPTPRASSPGRGHPSVSQARPNPVCQHPLPAAMAWRREAALILPAF